MKKGGYRITVFRDYSKPNKRIYLTEIVEVTLDPDHLYPSLPSFREKTVIKLQTTSHRTGYSLFDTLANFFPEGRIRYFGRPNVEDELLDHEELLMKVKEAISLMPIEKRFFSEKTRHDLLIQLTAQM